MHVQIPISYAVSISRLKNGYIIYMEKPHIVKFINMLRGKFSREQLNCDNFLCSVEEAGDLYH